MEHFDYRASPDLVFIANGKIKDHIKIASLIPKDAMVIAVDGGVFHCFQMGLTPNFLIGDLDSIDKEILFKFPGLDVIPSPSQEQFDLEKALTYPFKKNYKIAKVFGALGKRIDLTLANILLLARYPFKVIFETEKEWLFCIAGKTAFDSEPMQTLSLIPIAEPVLVKQTKGLKWNLHNAVLDKSFIGISNLSLENKVEIDVQKGELLVVIQKRDGASSQIG